MKKNLLLLLCAILLLSISCATSNPDKVDPVVHSVTMSEVTDREYPAEVAFMVLRAYIEDYFNPDYIEMDKENLRMTVRDYVFDGRVGMFRTAGNITADLIAWAEKDKIFFSLKFKEAEAKQKSALSFLGMTKGIARAGKEDLGLEANEIFSHFESMISYYAQLLGAGYLKR